MSVTYSLVAKNSRMQVIAGLIHSFAIGTSALNGPTGMLASATLGATTVAGGVLTLLSVPITTTATAAGTAALAEFLDVSGNVVASGLSVGTSGTDVIIANPNITVGESVTVNAGTITHG